MCRGGFLPSFSPSCSLPELLVGKEVGPGPHGGLFPVPTRDRRSQADVCVAGWWGGDRRGRAAPCVHRRCPRQARATAPSGFWATRGSRCWADTPLPGHTPTPHLGTPCFLPLSYVQCPLTHNRYEAGGSREGDRHSHAPVLGQWLPAQGPGPSGWGCPGRGPLDPRPGC